MDFSLLQACILNSLFLILFYVVISNNFLGRMFALQNCFCCYVQGIESEAGSPVDMAKTYMRSLPPWKSPSFSGVGFKTPRPSGMRHYKDETSYENSDNSLTLSKVLFSSNLFYRVKLMLFAEEIHLVRRSNG